ncbi:MAG: xanthine dehydrogenase family protein molybdopterin-binding subunit, partial [Acidobacteria bacterium]|nr:xanthine dehydrogenase family protein molybdopterin-binding subunit [Acidobacteriota bacterium]
MAGPHIGSPVPRSEDARLLTGRGKFIDDIRLPGMVCAHFLRSPYPHAFIQGIQFESALTLPGILGVWTAREIGSRVKSLRPVLESPSYRACEWPALATGKVRFVGEPVAVVVATDRYRAEDAAEAISVEYLPLPPIPDVETGLRDTQNRLHENLENNILFEYEFSSGNVEKAFQEADVRIARSFRHPRCTGMAIETRGVLAQFDPSRKLLTVWSSTQV